MFGSAIYASSAVKVLEKFKELKRSWYDEDTDHTEMHWSSNVRLSADEETRISQIRANSADEPDSFSHSCNSLLLFA